MRRWIFGVGQVAFEGKDDLNPWERLTNEDVRILRTIIEREKGQPGSGTVGW